jgi:hypothetical protein
MKLIDLIKSFFNPKPKNNPLEEVEINEKTYNEEKKAEIHSIWDFLQFNENTQASHLSSVIRFDEWVSMDEIRRRIWELFQIDYKNERSLYPYLKTMVDLGLIETSNIGGKRKWRKRDLLIKIEKKKKKSEDSFEEQEIMVSTQTEPN